VNKKISLFFVVICSLLGTGCQTLRVGKGIENSTYANFGDSIAYGAMAIPVETKSYGALVAKFLDQVHPHVTLANFGWPGQTSGNYLSGVPDMMKKIARLSSGPLKRATVFIGLSDVVGAEPKASPSQVEDYSFGFKRTVQKIIDSILGPYPTCRLVICTLPDANNGGKGPRDGYLPPQILGEFNKRILELATENKLQVADLYSALMGHTEYYLKDGHPNNLGHAKMALVIEEVFDPGQHPEPDGNTRNASGF
jgi:lysophospholipase L1-like esterase